MIDQQDSLPGHAFTIKRRSLLQRMIDVVANCDVPAKQRFAHSAIQTRALIFESGGSEIIKEESDKIEHRSRLEDDRVTAGGQFARAQAEVRFFAGAAGKFLRIERANIRRICFGPARGGIFLHRDGEFRMRLAVRREKAARIADNGLTLPASKNAGSNLAFLDSEVTGQANCTGPLVGGENCSPFYEAVHARVARFPRQVKKIWIFRLAVSQREGCLDGATKGIFVGAIGRGARRAAIHDSTNRNCEAMLSDVLMNAVVGEARQTVGDLVNMDLGFLGSRRPSQTNDRIDDPAKLALGEKFRGARFVPRSRLRDFGRRLHWFENAVPMRTFLKRAGDAP